MPWAWGGRPALASCSVPPELTLRQARAARQSLLSTASTSWPPSWGSAAPGMLSQPVEHPVEGQGLEGPVLERGQRGRDCAEVVELGADAWGGDKRRGPTVWVFVGLTARGMRGRMRGPEPAGGMMWRATQ